MTDQYRTDIGEQLEDSHQTAVAEVTRLPKLIDAPYCTAGATGLTLKTECTFRDYSTIIKRMDNLAYAHSVRDGLFRFYIGDAFNGGEVLFGERYSNVMHKLHWSQGYISNIQWVARNVPADVRDIKLCNWKFWSAIAPLDYEDQKFWVSEALEELKIGESWASRIGERMGSWMVRREIDAIEDPELREHVEEMVKADPTIPWTQVRKHRQDKYAPQKPQKPADWWVEKLEDAELSREGVLEMAMLFVTEIKRHRVKL